MPDRSGFGLENCGARRILSLFGLNIYKKDFLLPLKLHKKYSR